MTRPLVLLLVLGPAAAAAQPATGGAIPVRVDVPPDRTAIDALGAAIAARATQALEEVPGGDVLLVAADDLPAGSPRGAALVGAVTEPARAALASSSRFSSVVAEEVAVSDRTVREAAARGFDALVTLRLQVLDNDLRVEGTASRLPGGFGGLLGGGQILGTFTAVTPLDAQLRTYVGALPPLTDTSVTARPLGLPGHGYAAMAAADLDGDGRAELVLATAHRVDVMRLGPGPASSGSLLRIARIELPDDLPAPAVRPARTFGTAVVQGSAVVVRLSEHAAPISVTLDGGGRVERATGPCPDETFPLPDACAVAVTGRDYFAAPLRPRGEGASPEAAMASFYARVRLLVRQPDGSSAPYEAVVSPRGRIATRVMGVGGAAAAGYGAALALADLDEDGRPEMLVSSDRAEGEGDQLSVLRMRPNGGVYAVWTSEAMTGSVLLATAADLDGDGLVELLAVEEPPPRSPGRGRLWIVR